MDLSKLTTADRVIAGSAILFLISMFLPWYGFDEDFVDFSNSGTDYFLTGWLPLLLAVIMVAQVAISRFSPQTKLPSPPLPWGQVHLIAGATAAVLLVLRLVIASDNVGDIDIDFDLDRKFGLIVAVIAALGLAAGGFLKSKETEGTAAPGSGPATPF